MTPDRWEQLAKLFSEALEREGPDRDKFLKAACEGDAELCEEARRLLANHERAGDFLSDPAVTLREADEPAPLFDIDQLIAGRFRIVRFIARGGMGEVYEAEDLALNTRLALKTIRRNLAGEPGLALFKQEIQSARKVTHPNVCRIYDIAEHGDPPVMLLTMELLDGPTLSRQLREHGPFSRREALPLIAQIAAGLQAAHDAGVIHRDFKSGNIILAPAPGGWRPVITDFGLALPAGSVAEHTGRRAGTPGYMAPEQREGGPVTPATDVYALGVVIARMTGASEPSGSRGSSSPADPPRDVSAERRKLGPWTGVVQRCLETEPAKRFQRPAEVAAALRRASALRPRVLVALAAVLACLAAFIWLNGRAGRQQTVDRQVSADAGVGYFSVSKDGRYLVYGDGKTGNLAVRDLRRNTTRVLASRQRGPGGGPASGLISPDNNQVAYRWHYETNAPWELCIVPLAGGASRVLLRGEEAGAAIQPLA